MSYHISILFVRDKLQEIEWLDMSSLIAGHFVNRLCFLKLSRVTAKRFWMLLFIGEAHDIVNGAEVLMT